MGKVIAEVNSANIGESFLHFKEDDGRLSSIAFGPAALISMIAEAIEAEERIEQRHHRTLNKTACIIIARCLGRGRVGTLDDGRYGYER